MSSIAVDSTLERSLHLYQASIGKKLVMAATGVVLFGFVVLHLLGNLQVYLGQEVFDAYAAKLRGMPALLWGFRAVLLTSVVLHIVTATQLWLLSRRARPTAYVVRKPVASTYASRTMYWSGPMLAAFIIYHLLHFTTGQAHPSFVDTHVYDNLVSGFRQIPASVAYIIAMSMLGLHLYHGVWSMFQSVGVNHPRYTPWLKRFAAAATIFIVGGNISIPVAVLAGLVR